GLGNDPVVAERLRLSRLRTLAEAMNESWREKMKPSAQEVETFYAENRDRFEEVQLRGLIIPKNIDKQPKPDEAKAIANDLLARATAGEDKDKLEAEAYQKTKAAGAPPNTSLGWRGRGRLGPHEDDIVKLKTGQVSPLYDDANNLYIFKV